MSLMDLNPHILKSSDFLKQEKQALAAAGFVEVQVPPVLVEGLGIHVEKLTMSTQHSRVMVLWGLHLHFKHKPKR